MSRVIEAPASRIFAVLADPNEHSAIDGTGTLIGPGPGCQPVSAAGQTFRMGMYHVELGDYQMINTVTSFLPETRIAWAPALDPSCELAKILGHMKVAGHTFSFELRPAEEGTTQVIHTFDWSRVDEPTFAEMCSLVSANQLATTLERLAARVERPKRPVWRSWADLGRGRDGEAPTRARARRPDTRETTEVRPPALALPSPAPVVRGGPGAS